MSSEEKVPSSELCTRERTCPSGRCREGSILLGIVGLNGVVGYVTPTMRVSAVFVAKARQGREPETRFRFAEPCVQHQCMQWAGNRCGLIHQVLDSTTAERLSREPTPLPECVIRASCQWFGQVGPRACAICPHVVHTLRDGKD